MKGREEFLRERRELGPRRMDDLFAPIYDEHWGEVSPSHGEWVDRFVELTPDGGLLLDAACGTGKYWLRLMSAGRQVVGVDRSSGMLAQASSKHPGVETQRLELEALVHRGELHGRFDGVLCVDAMEGVFPEDWPLVLAGFVRVLKPGAPCYLTVELPEEDDLSRIADPPPPLVRGEIIWPDEHGGNYHFFPSWARVVGWLEEAGLEPIDSAEADDVIHVLCRSP